MKEHLLHFAGKWRQGSGDKQYILNPANEEVIGYFKHAATAELEEAVKAASEGLAEWDAVSPWEKGAVLRKAADILRDRTSMIAQLLTSEQGKPIAQAGSEIQRAADFLEWNGEQARRIAARRFRGRIPGDIVEIDFVPIGPVAAFTPWNFPVVLAAKKIGAILAAGCSCIIKPAEETPASSSELIRALLDAGIPPKALNMVLGKPEEISSYLISHPVIRKVTFTGSVPIGKSLAAIAGSVMKPVTMELGGHAPVIVFADADIDAIADTMVTAKILNSGQVCISPTRFFIERSVCEHFTERFTEGLSKVQIGDGMESGVQMGPLANDRRLKAVDELVQDAVTKGARLQTGGKRIGDKGYFYAPTVLTDIPMDSRIMREEPFGPVAPVVAFDSEEEAVSMANAVDYGLAGYLFTKDAACQQRVANALECGTVGVNMIADHFAEIPLGGWKDSGYGTEGGIETLLPYLKSKYKSIRACSTMD